MQDFASVAFEKYQIPYISFRDLVWPEYNNPPETLPEIWNGMSHPDQRAHKLIAKLISYGFMMQLKESHTVRDEDCSLTKKGKENEENPNSRYFNAANTDPTIKPICDTVLTQMMATDTPTSQDNFKLIDTPPSTWRFYNDSKLKYGWILEFTKEDVRASCKEGGSDSGTYFNYYILIIIIIYYK